MDSWRQLESDFRQLQPAMEFVRLDAQWGDAGEYWRLAGGGNRLVQERFTALAELAGKKLLTLSANQIPDEVTAEPDHVHRWFKALWRMGGFMETDIPARMLNDDGSFAGHIFGGTIRDPAEASAVLCLRLHTHAPSTYETPPAMPEPQLSRASIFWEKYGAPTIIAVVATVVGGVLLALLL